MAAEDFLVTTTIGDKSRKFVWDSHKPIPLDYPNRWYMKRTPNGVILRDVSAQKTDKSRTIRIPMSSLVAGDAYFDLPPPAQGPGRIVRLTLRPLKHLPAPYDAPVSSNSLTKGNPSQLYVYWGVKDCLVHYDRDAGNFRGLVEGKLVFRTKWIKKSIELTPIKDDVFISMEGVIQTFTAGVPVLVTPAQLAGATIAWDNYWWRLVRVPMPPAIPVEALREEENHEKKVVRKIYAGVAGIALVLFSTILAWPRPPVAKIKLETTISLKEPKIIPKQPEIPTPVAVEVPRPRMKMPPVPKRVERSEPNPKPQPQKPPPSIQQAAKPMQAPVNVDPRTAPQVAQPSAPTPAAPTAQQQQQQLAQSLNFLSTKSNGPVSGKPTPNAKADARYDSTAGAATKSTDKGTLNSLATGRPADGPIATKGARNVDGNVNLAGAPGGKGKALNGVQGRVALNSLYSQGSGDLGGTLSQKGINMSGPGTIAEGELEKILGKYLQKFQYCYEKALLTEPGLAGNMVMQWTINPNGGVSQAHVVRSQLNSPPLHNCVGGEISKIKFPPPKGGSVTVKYPLAFSSSSL